MKKCKRCGSCAINEHSHGRIKGINTDLCDVCYWRAVAESLTSLETEPKQQIKVEGN